MSQQSMPVVHNTWAQLLPSLNGFYDAQLDSNFDKPDDTPVYSPTSTAAPAAQLAPSIANHTWAQLLPSFNADQSSDDYDARFAAEEEELKRAGIIQEPVEELSERAKAASTPSAALAAQITWHAALTQSSEYPDVGNANEAVTMAAERDQAPRKDFAAGVEEDVLADHVRGARTPRRCLAAQVRWCETRGQI